MPGAPAGETTKRRVGSRLLSEHTSGVFNVAVANYYPGVDFGPAPGEGWRPLLGEVLRLHDLGKLTPYFQAHLLGAKPNVPPGSDAALLRGHTHFGALQAYARLRDRGELAAYLVAYLIAHHHRSLSQPSSADDPLLLVDEDDYDRRARITEEQADALPAIGKARRALSVPDLEIHRRPLPEHKDACDLAAVAEDWRSRSKKRRRGGARGLSTFFATNYLFSLLVEADKLDASGTPAYQRRGSRAQRVDAYVEGLVGAPVPLPPAGGPIAADDPNARRNQARADVLNHLDAEGILDQRLFTLTAPTGLGKTLTGLHFALGLRERLQAARGAEAAVPQIIVALPFVNIIEQTLAVYEAVLNPEGTPNDERLRILGHYQYADVLSDRDPGTHPVAGENEDARDYACARMSLDTWQADVVVTSFVQLFGSLATGRNAALKKFNHLAGAILVLDEVQSLPNRLAPFAGTLLYACAKHLDTRVLMMTATQPRIDAHVSGLLRACRAERDLPPALELLGRADEYFAVLRRTRLRIELEEPLVDTLDEDGEVLASAEETFVERLRAASSPRETQLIVVNTVNRSLAVYRALAAAYAEDIDAGRLVLAYLSTNVLPVQRERRVREVRDALSAFRQNGRDAGRSPNVFLVATQVVEAGVDLDFDRGWRDMAPMTSLIQVAGRVNRNGTLDEPGDVHVVRFADRRTRGTGYRYDGELIYESTEHQSTFQALRRLAGRYGGPIPEREYGALVAAYFDATDPGRGGTYGVSEELFLAAEKLDYGRLKDFRLIEEQTTVAQVYVPWDAPHDEAPIGGAALSAYREVATAAVDVEARRTLREAFERAYGTAFRKRLLNVPKRLVDGTDGAALDAAVDGGDLLFVPVGELPDRYDDATGWRRDAANPQVMIF